MWGGALRVLSLLIFAGCHVFADGTVDVTCDDLPACSSVVDTAADTGEFLATELSLGVGLAATDGERWSISAHEAPELSLTFQRSGLGDFGGPVDYNPLTGRALVATTQRLYVFGPEDDAIASHLMPTTQPPVALLRASFGALILTSGSIVYQEAPAEAPILIIPSTVTVEGPLLSAFSSSDKQTAYLISAGSTGAGALYAYTPGAGLSLVEEGFAPGVLTLLGGGGFIGPDNEILFCSVDGAVHKLTDLVAGDSEAMLQLAATADIIRCAWDETASRYLALQSDGALQVTSTSGETTAVALLRDGLSATSGHFFE
ncbi:MAG: hypothetical protein ACI8S6_004052 [Myxococcota bacterium]